MNDIKDIIQECHKIAKEKGFWDRERNVGEMLMLIVSELGEAIEAHRKGRRVNSDIISVINESDINGLSKDNKFISFFNENIKDTFEDEIADAVIRLFDMCEGLGIDIEKYILLKLEYNKTREKLHGKKY